MDKKKKTQQKTVYWSPRQTPPSLSKRSKEFGVHISQSQANLRKTKVIFADIDAKCHSKLNAK